MEVNNKELVGMLKRAQTRVDLYQKLTDVLLDETTQISPKNMKKMEKIFSKLAKVGGTK